MESVYVKMLIELNERAVMCVEPMKELARAMSNFKFKELDNSKK